MDFSLSIQLNISSNRVNNSGMKDWLDDIGDQLDGLAETRREMQKAQLHNAEVIKHKAPSRWNELATSIEQDVKRWNDKYPDRDERTVEFQRVSDNKITVSKTFFPTMRLDVEFRLGAEVISCRYMRRESAASSPVDAGVSSLEFLVGTDNEVYLVRERKTVTIEDASRWLLTPIFNSCR